MGSGVLLRAPAPLAGVKAPPFTPQEHALIAAWADTAASVGLRVVIDLDFHAELAEALLVFAQRGPEPAWLAHKTPGGQVALRLWPGIADIVPTVDETLAIIAAQMARGAWRYTPAPRAAAGWRMG